MPAVARTLIVGGGFSGMAAAIQLRKAGIDVTLVEQDPAWCPIGAGITLGGATLRALETLGVYDEFLEHGATSDAVVICLANGTEIARIPSLPPEGSSVPGTGGIILKCRSGAKIEITDIGITIDNGKGAKIEMLGPQINLNSGALTII